MSLYTARQTPPQQLAVVNRVKVGDLWCTPLAAVVLKNELDRYHSAQRRKKRGSKK